MEKWQELNTTIWIPDIADGNFRSSVYGKNSGSTEAEGASMVVRGLGSNAGAHVWHAQAKKWALQPVAGSGDVMQVATGNSQSNWVPREIWKELPKTLNQIRHNRWWKQSMSLCEKAVSRSQSLPDAVKGPNCEDNGPKVLGWSQSRQSGPPPQTWDLCV